MPVAKLSSGIDLYYESHGHGEPVVFIPGTGFAGNVWAESQVKELARSYRVIIHDPRGCGRSTHPKGVYTIGLMGNDVVALLDYLAVPKAHVIGHSMDALAYPSR
jgi:pimeloyl-ACP methyl ester carboxylesterase